MNFPLKEIQEIANVIAGQSPPSSTYNQDEKGLPFYQGMADFTEKHPYTTMWCDSPIKISEPGDILMSVRAPVGPVNLNKIQACIGRGISAIRLTEAISPEYLFYFLRTQTRQIASLGVGSTFKAITQKEIKKIKVPLPDYQEQVKIALVLDKVEKLFMKRKESIELLDKLLKDTFLTMFESYISESNEKLSDHSEIRSGLTKGKKNLGKETFSVPYMRVANVQDGYLNLEEILEIEATENEIRKYALEYNDLLLTEGGDPDKLGRGALWKNQIENCIHQNHIFRVRIMTDLLLPDFLSHLVSCEYGKRYFLKRAKQTTGIATINSTQLKEFPVCLPPKILQERFALLVNKIETLKNKYKQSLTELQYLAGSVNQKAFKGELDLENLSIDHIIPRSKGGSDDFENLDVLTKEDNIRKADKTPEQWQAFKKAQKEIREPRELSPVEYFAWQDENERDWMSLSIEELADWLKKDFNGFHFTSEILIHYLFQERNVKLPKGQPLYYSSEEIKKKGLKLDRQKDLKVLLFEWLGENAAFLELEQVFYDQVKENIQLNLRRRDYEFLQSKNVSDRSGVYLKVKS